MCRKATAKGRRSEQHGSARSSSSEISASRMLASLGSRRIVSNQSEATGAPVEIRQDKARQKVGQDSQRKSHQLGGPHLALLRAVRAAKNGTIMGPVPAPGAARREVQEVPPDREKFLLAKGSSSALCLHVHLQLCHAVPGDGPRRKLRLAL